MSRLLTPPLKTTTIMASTSLVLQNCLNHIPKAHYLIVLGDFNIVLRADPPFVGTEDPRRLPNVHKDSHVL